MKWATTPILYSRLHLFRWDKSSFWHAVNRSPIILWFGLCVGPTFLYVLHASTLYHCPLLIDELYSLYDKALHCTTFTVARGKNGERVFFKILDFVSKWLPSYCNCIIASAMDKDMGRGGDCPPFRVRPLIFCPPPWAREWFSQL